MFEQNNPIIPGLYADPDIIKVNGKYYLYPTTDGHIHWSGTKFYAFSSENRKDWVCEGMILDVASNQVPWAVGSAWAPAMYHRKGKFYFYFCAKRENGDSCIGVAVSNEPDCGFTAMDEPLLTPEIMRAEGADMWQTIDPSVYEENGSVYLLFGNGKAAIVELSDDLCSIKKGTMKNIEGLTDFREAVNVVKRNDKYHFTWSCDDTGSENYHVNYGVADNLYGPVTYRYPILEKCPEKGIFGTGHHCILQDEEDLWYIGYHRFATPVEKYPEGKGWHREVCLSPLAFNEENEMKKVKQNSTEELIWAESIAEKIIKKVSITAERNKDKIPYTTVNGVFDDWSVPDRVTWWTNGFFAGQLWQLYNLCERRKTCDKGTQKDDEKNNYHIFREVAEKIEKKLDANLMSYMGMDHDSGFKWLLTSVANYKLTGNAASKNRALLAAANLAGRFNPTGKFIRAWNDSGDGNTAGWAIIDCMMNLPLLYWATGETNDPRFKQIAMLHADTAIKAFIRDDGSANHIVSFNPATGEIIESLGGQGVGVGSSWTRGQAWALYGFTLSYLHTEKQEYLETAKKVASYFISNIPESGFIPVDFCQPQDCTWEDSTAAAIAACGLLELEKYVDEQEKSLYHSAAIRMLTALAESRCNWDENIDNIVEKCTAAYHDEKHEFSIIYGDYFFTEAVLKVCEKGVFLW